MICPTRISARKRDGSSPLLASLSSNGSPSSPNRLEKAGFGALNTDDGLAPALHADDVLILKTLRQSKASLRQFDIEGATGLDRKTIAKRLPRLRELGFIERPNGKRGGEAITAAGRKVISGLK